MPAHGLGPMWVATPSSQWTCTTYSLPVSRRTCAKTRAFSLLVESSSQFGQSENQKCWRRLSEEGTRENGSTLFWLAHVFTRPGTQSGPLPSTAMPVRAPKPSLPARLGSLHSRSVRVAQRQLAARKPG
jgi:hypothetical protein